MKVLKKAEHEMENGRLWRAKEILQGSIANPIYNTEVFEMLGRVLLQMGDLPDAGKYLFLSGTRKEEYVEAIEVFLQKYSEPAKLFRTFPRSAKLRRFAEYPPQLALDLKELGFQEPLKEATNVVEPTASDIIPLLIFLSFVLGVLVLVILGIVKLVEIVI